MNERLETGAIHSNGLSNAVLAVHNEFLRQPADDLPARRQRHRAGRIYGPLNIVLGDLLVRPRDRDDAVLVLAAQVLAREIYRRHLDIEPAHSLGLAHRSADRFGNRLGRSDYAATQALRFCFADTHNIHLAARARLADDTADAACANIQADCLYFVAHN